MTHPEKQPHIEPLQGRTPDPAVDDTTDMVLAYRKNRIRIGLVMAFVGYLVFLLGARPNMFGLDRSPVVGFVQISVFLLGLAIICLGSFLTLSAIYQREKDDRGRHRLSSDQYRLCCLFLFRNGRYFWAGKSSPAQCPFWSFTGTWNGFRDPYDRDRIFAPHSVSELPAWKTSWRKFKRSPAVHE